MPDVAVFSHSFLEPDSSRRAFGSLSFSLLGHAAATAILLAVPVALPPQPAPAERHIATLIPPPPAVAPPALRQPKPVRLPAVPPTRAFVAPALRAPATRVEEPPKAAMEPPPLAIPSPKPVDFVPPPVASAPPAPVIRTDNLAPVIAKAAPAPVRALIQSSGFTSAQSAAPAASRPAAGNVGAFNSISAPAAAPRPASRPAAGNVGAFNSVTAPAAAPRSAAISTGAFGDTVAAPAARTAPAPVAAIQDSPVEIVSKPRPVYTDEARKLHIEGEVLLEVLFTASGETRVLRRVRGLGHGLDEAASEAARQIRFRPATHAGAPVDSSAVVHITFQLALGDLK